jgi:hypothetical protein
VRAAVAERVVSVVAAVDLTTDSGREARESNGGDAVRRSHRQALRYIF